MEFNIDVYHLPEKFLCQIVISAEGFRKTINCKIRVPEHASDRLIKSVITKLKKIGLPDEARLWLLQRLDQMVMEQREYDEKRAAQ